MFFEKGLETFFGINPEYSDLYFCVTTDGNNKTGHLFKHLMDKDIGSWISTGMILNGNGRVTTEKWLDVEGDIERWLTKKVKEFEFLLR